MTVSKSELLQFIEDMYEVDAIIERLEDGLQNLGEALDWIKGLKEDLVELRKLVEENEKDTPRES